MNSNLWKISKRFYLTISEINLNIQWFWKHKDKEIRFFGGEYFQFIILKYFLKTDKNKQIDNMSYLKN
jgi:hypothetical protein